MSVGTYSSSVKLVDEVWDKSSSERRWRKHAGVESKDDLPNRTYTKRFCWYDSSDMKNFGSYKLPIWDYKGGEFVNIRAVRNAKARLSQTADIPSGERKKIENMLDKYLNRWNKETNDGYNKEDKNMRVKDKMRLDDNETVFFKRQLEYIKARTYDTKYKDLKAFSLIPISAEAPSGATEITWRSFSKYGLAKIIADYAYDFPRVDVFGEENTVKIKDIGVSYGYSIKEIRRAMLAGFDLEARRASVARRAVEEKMNALAWSGDDSHNIQGFLDYPGITEYAVPATGTGSSKEWADKTADQILTDLNGIVSAITEGTSGKERPNMILMPLGQYNLIRNTRVGSYSDKTIFQFFTENNPDITVDWLTELDEAGAGGTDRFMAYTRDEEHLTLEIPLMFEQFEPQQKGMEYEVPCYGEFAGVIVYYPLSVAYGDGI